MTKVKILGFMEIAIIRFYRYISDKKNYDNLNVIYDKQMMIYV